MDVVSTTAGGEGAASSGASASDVNAHQNQGGSQAAAPAAPAAGTNDWTSGLSQDMRGFVQNKAYTNPGQVIEGYQQMEKLLGAKESLVKLPSTPDAAEWNDVYTRLGRPQSAKDYKFGADVSKGGDEKFTNWAKENFFELGLSAKQAESLAERFDKYSTSLQQENTNQQAEVVAKQEQDLRREWGKAFDDRVNYGKQAARELGIKPEVIDTLQNAMGFADVMKLMAKLGETIGEGKFVRGSGGQKSFGNMTPEMAINRINTLKADPTFTQRYLAGDGAAKEEFTRLHSFAYPGE